MEHNKLTSVVVGLVAVISSPILWAGEAEITDKEAAKRSYDYAREENIVYYGRTGDASKWKVLFKRCDHTLIHCAYALPRIYCRGVMEANVWQSDIRGPEKSVMSANVLRFDSDYDLKKGETFSDGPKGSVFFITNMPSTGCDLFFLPMWDLLNKQDDSNGGVARMSSPDALKPHFTGNWYYRIDKWPANVVRVSGPYCMSTYRDDYRIFGAMSYDVERKPFHVVRQSSDSLITIRSDSPSLLKVNADFLKDITQSLRVPGSATPSAEVRGHYRYRLTLCDSKAHCPLQISDRLWAAFESISKEQ